jgi:hypothetical protein
VTLHAEKHYQGPIPQAVELKGYQEVDVALPDRIVTMAEKELDHRIGMEQAAAEEQVRINTRVLDQKNRGQKYGLTVAIAGMGWSTVPDSNWVRRGLQPRASASSAYGAWRMLERIVGFEPIIISLED